jgi:hypothetical protein
VRSLALIVEALIPERLLGVRRIGRARSVRDLAELRALSSDVFAPDSARAVLAQKIPNQDGMVIQLVIGMMIIRSLLKPSG